MDFLDVGVISPEVGEKLAAGDGSFWVFEAAGVGGVAVVEAEDGTGLEPDDGVVAAKLGGEIGADIAPVIFDAFGPIGGTVDGAAIEEEDFFWIGGDGAIFLVDLEAINFPLDVAAAGEIEFVPAGLQGVVDLGGGFGDEDEFVGMSGDDLLCDDGFAGSGAAGEDDTVKVVGGWHGRRDGNAGWGRGKA